MPIRVFSEEEKKELQEKMFEAGLKLIREFGLTHTTITKITQYAGIGKSTFYNFFESKEMFVIELIRYERRKAMEMVKILLAGRKQMTKEEGKKLLYMIIYHQDSVYQYLTEKDVKSLYPAMEKEGLIEDDLNSDIPQYLLDIIEGTREDANPKVFVNFLRMMAICVAQKESLHQDVIKQNIDMIFDTMFDYIFKM